MTLFITMEGGEGGGKTTQLRLLQESLAGRGWPVLITREPGGCRIADRIRAILLDPDHHELAPRAELLLYAAARAQHVEQVIRPALAAGVTVLCDRFSDATVAYQGGGRGLDTELIATLDTIATDGLQPDLTLLLDFPAEAGLKRAQQRNLECALHTEGRFEAENLAFHARVRAAYLAMAANHPRFRVIDARGTIDLVAQRIAATIDSFITARGGS